MGTNVTSLDWVTYPSLRFKDHPNVTPIVIQQLDAVPGGAGEEPISALFPRDRERVLRRNRRAATPGADDPAVVRDALARAGLK